MVKTPEKARVGEELRLRKKKCYVKQISVLMMKRFTLTAASLLLGLSAAMAQNKWLRTRKLPAMSLMKTATR